MCGETCVRLSTNVLFVTCAVLSVLGMVYESQISLGTNCPYGGDLSLLHSFQIVGLAFYMFGFASYIYRAWKTCCGDQEARFDDCTIASGFCCGIVNIPFYSCCVGYLLPIYNNRQTLQDEGCLSSSAYSNLTKLYAVDSVILTFILLDLLFACALSRYSKQSFPTSGQQLRERLNSEDRRTLSAVALIRLGFNLATQQNKYALLSSLQRIQPSGSTALRDAINLGLIRQLGLKAILDELNTVQEYKFINIVLTDGEDTSSQISSYDMKRQFNAFQQQLAGLCKIFLIGVQLNKEAEQELQSIAYYGGNNISFYNIADMDIASIFDRIQIEIGIRDRAALIANENAAVVITQRNYEVGLRLQKYIMLFTLDISGSMAGSRWRNVTEAVRNFCNNTMDNDIFGVMLFNDKAQFISFQ